MSDNRLAVALELVLAHRYLDETFSDDSGTAYEFARLLDGIQTAADVPQYEVAYIREVLEHTEAAGLRLHQDDGRSLVSFTYHGVTAVEPFKLDDTRIKDGSALRDLVLDAVLRWNKGNKRASTALGRNKHKRLRRSVDLFEFDSPDG